MVIPILPLGNQSIQGLNNWPRVGQIVSCGVRSQTQSVLLDSFPFLSE